jgi:regulatory protein
MDESPILKAIRDKAMQCCSRKEYSSAEMKKKILSWGCPPDDAPSVIAFLNAQHFLDDLRFAQSYTNDKLRFSKWGCIKIRYMLRMQGVEENIIEEVLESLDADQYMKYLQDELQKKHKSIKNSSPADIKAKLVRFAASRGFESDVIYQTLRFVR